MWWAYFETASGQLLSVGSDVLSQAEVDRLLASGIDRKEYASRPDVDAEWDTVARDFVVLNKRGLITTWQFWMRFTAVEREDIFDAAVNHANATVRKRINAFVWLVSSVQKVDMDDAYVEGQVRAAETAGLVGAGRADQILAGA